MSSSKLHPDIKHILLKLPEDTLFALTATVTQGLLKNKITRRHGLQPSINVLHCLFIHISVIEAIEVIIKYSPNELSILKRKLVTKEVLFDYLHERDIVTPLPTTKSALIDIICNCWNLKKLTIEFEDCKSDDTSDATTENIVQLGEKFSEWFYNMLNTSVVIGPEHFWRDANMILNLISDTQTITEEVKGDSEKIAAVLSSTKNLHNLFFNPNLTKEGIKTKMNPHGLVIVEVCGTLHTNTECVGVFEQAFGLARDPFSENNWKIKCTQVNLRSKSGVKELPRLCDSEENNVLSITEW